MTKHQLFAVLGIGALALPMTWLARAQSPSPQRCPSEMVEVGGFCIDRWEASMVDKATREPLSPYYPPQPRMLREVFRAWELERHLMGDESARAMPLPAVSDWQRTHTFEAMAVSRPGKVPQAFVSYPLAERACQNAGKRLCTHEEWQLGCRGRRGTKFPYGDQFDRAKCNVWGHIHPAYVLHQNSSVGHRDPRLNLLAESGTRALLRRTGATPTCASTWDGGAIYDMVGNVDEWVADEHGKFVGGFYARSTSKGCESQVTNHAHGYYDYSTGVRCCKNVE